MTRISHAPEGYICPFCLLVQGIENKHVGSKQADIFYKDDYITGFIASHWWPNNPGHALVIQNQHIENIYNLEIELSTRIHALEIEVSKAFKQGVQASIPMRRSIITATQRTGGNARRLALSPSRLPSLYERQPVRY